MDIPATAHHQILKLEWKYLMPLSLINLVLMTAVVALGLYIK